MICPKCGFEQPESPECMRCGIVVSRYKGPVFGGAPAPAVVPQAPPLPSQPLPMPQTASTGTMFGDLAPAAAMAVAGGGTVYEGPMPAVAGGTVYQGPGPEASRAPVPRHVVGVTRKLTVGEILSESFSIYFKNLIPFTMLTALAFAPIFLLAGFLGQEVAAKNPLAAGNAVLVMVLTLLLCIPMATAAINYGVFQQMRGRDTSLVDCMRVGLSCLLPVLSVAFLQILVVVAVFIASIIPVVFLIGGAVAGSSGRSTAGLGCAVLIIPLLLLCYVPPIMIWLKYFVAVPAAVEERPGPVNALKRSAFLTHGQRWPIFGAVFVLGFLNTGSSLVSALIPGVGAVLGPLVSLVMCGIFSTTSAVVYYRLRSIKESIDVDQISSVFA